MHALLNRIYQRDEIEEEEKKQGKSTQLDWMKCHVVEILFTRKENERVRVNVKVLIIDLSRKSINSTHTFIRFIDSYYDDDDEKVF